LICDLFYGKKIVLKQIIIKKKFPGQVECLIINGKQNIFTLCEGKETEREVKG